jgi:hypothetical protein
MPYTEEFMRGDQPADPKPSRKKATKTRSKRKAARGKLLIGATDIELDKVPIICPNGARITLSWDSNRKGLFVLGMPHTEITLLPQGPNALVLKVR